MTTSRRPGRRTLTLLLRDTRGRFMRVLPTLAERAAAAHAKRTRAPRRHRRPTVLPVQLARF